jgi:hypothetical protein
MHTDPVASGDAHLQARVRVFMLAARSGFPLPPLPLPVYDADFQGARHQVRTLLFWWLRRPDQGPGGTTL